MLATRTVKRHFFNASTMHSEEVFDPYCLSGSNPKVPWPHSLNTFHRICIRYYL